MNKVKLILAASSLFIASAFTAQAQYRTETDTRYSEFGADAGDWEFTLGGSGTTDNDFDNSTGGFNGSVGYFLTDTFEVAVRQTVNFSNGPGDDDAEFDGSTFVAVDQHFGTGPLRPFVGLNFGALYGDNTSDTWAAGIEGGLKLYVLPKTFIFGLVNYAWTFDDGEDADDTFDDGAFLWSVGVGFNF